MGDYIQIKKEEAKEEEKREGLRAISEAAEMEESILIGEPPILDPTAPPLNEI